MVRVVVSRDPWPREMKIWQAEISLCRANNYYGPHGAGRNSYSQVGFNNYWHIIRTICTQAAYIVFSVSFLRVI